MVHEASADNQAASKSNKITDNTKLAVETKEQENVMPVVSVTILQPMSETPVVVNKSASEIVQVELYTPFRQEHSCTAALGIMDVFSGRPFCIRTANTTSFVINLAKHQCVAMTCRLVFKINQKNDQPSRIQCRSPFLITSMSYSTRWLWTVGHTCINSRRPRT